MEGKYRLAIVVDFPIQYQVPFFKKLSKLGEIDLTVLFFNKHFIDETKDPDFNNSFKWDIPMLEGYKYKFLIGNIKMPFSRYNSRFNPWIIKELCREKYDAVWIHGYAGINNWMTFLGAWISRTHVFFRGESNLIEKRTFPVKFLKRLFLCPLFKGVDVFLAIGSLNREYYQKYGVKKQKIHLLPYAVDNDFFNGWYQRFKEQKSNLKKSLGIADGKLVILSAGKLIPRKCVFDIIKAYERMRMREEVILVIVGDGAQRYIMEEYVRMKNLKGIYFEGFKNQLEIVKYYAIADIFVLPSVGEPWGLVINEAMNFRMPIVASDRVGAGYDLIKEGKNGYVFPANDILSLTEALEKLIGDKDTLEKMGRKSFEIIEEWNFDDCINVLKNIIIQYKRGD